MSRTFSSRPQQGGEEYDDFGEEQAPSLGSAPGPGDEHQAQPLEFDIPPMPSDDFELPVPEYEGGGPAQHPETVGAFQPDFQPHAVIEEPVPAFVPTLKVPPPKWQFWRRNQAPKVAKAPRPPKQPKSAKVKASKEKKASDIAAPVFADRFCIGSVTISDKKVARYIAGVAHKRFQTDDFYYAYTLNDSRLNFIIIAADSYVAGRISVFTPAFVGEGGFCYGKPGSGKYHLVANDGMSMTHEISPEPRADYTTLNESPVPLQGVPATLRLKWSLEKPLRWYNAALTAVLFICVCAFGYVQGDASVARQEQEKLARQVKRPQVTRGLPDVYGPLWDTVNKVRGLAKITLVTKSDTENKLKFVLKFVDNADATGFISQYGGQYEGEQVIYTVNLLERGASVAQTTSPPSSASAPAPASVPTPAPAPAPQTPAASPAPLKK